MLSNSAAAGALAAGYVLVLLLQLNPRLSIEPGRLVSLAATVGVFYAIHFTAVFYVILVVCQLAASTLFSPAWISVTVLARLGTLSAAGAAVLLWANVRSLSTVLEPETAAAMLDAAFVVAAAAVLFGVVALGRGATPGLAWVRAISLLVLGVASLAVPVALRASPGAVREPLPNHAGVEEVRRDATASVTLIAMDGGSLDVIASAAAQGRLPNFGRILDSGAVMHLATLHPTSPEAVWSAVATGKLPHKNGIRSGGIYRLPGSGEIVRLLPDFCLANALMRFGFLTDEAYTAESIRARPLWSILTRRGRSTGVINWPLTYPAPAVHGYVVSDRYARVFTSVGGIVDDAMVHPVEVRGEIVPIADDSDGGAPALPMSVADVLSARYQIPGRTDLALRAVATTLGRSRPTDVTMMRYESLDAMGHYFLRYATPSAFGDVTEEERSRFGPVLEAHYAVIDEAIGRVIETLGPENLLLVISGYGMEPLGLGKRLLERTIGDPEVNATHENAPDGFLLAYGGSIARGRPRRASVVDVVPTVLYFLGLPIGRDMDGFARTDLFQKGFTADRPITFIPTYDR